MKLSNALLVGSAALLLIGGCSTGNRLADQPQTTDAAFDRSTPVERGSSDAIPPSERIAMGTRDEKSEASDSSQVASAAVAEQIQAAKPRQPLTDLMIKVADFGTDEPMTPRDFHSPPGARIAHVEF